MKVIPGQPLALVSECIPSSGTFTHSDKVYSSLLGTRIWDTSTSPPTLSVIRPGHTARVPHIGSIVIGRIVRMNPRFALVSIQMIDASPCSEPFSGLIRLQDIRATERDKVQVYDCFRPGDIVRASVISLGDAHSFYLSTAQNDLGVIFATSVAGKFYVNLFYRTYHGPHLLGRNDVSCHLESRKKEMRETVGIKEWWSV